MLLAEHEPTEGTRPAKAEKIKIYAKLAKQAHKTIHYSKKMYNFALRKAKRTKKAHQEWCSSG